jgi:tetratricopeptide (TPR) repeat protein
MDAEHDDILQRLETLREKAGEFLDKCYFRSAYRVYGEVARLAKTEQKLIHYMHATFHQMDLALDLLQPEITREKAVELIALLESEDRARQIQPDFPAGPYERTIAWMSACAYENLAEATGRLDGYNSEGMHGCITDGIQVCRQTGKLACIRCFREYATEVYTAADDSDMALHYTRSIACHQGEWSDRGNRRWLGSKNEASLLVLDGQLDAAEESLARARQQVSEERVSLPIQAGLRVAADLETILLAGGKLDPAKLEASDGPGLRANRRPLDEFPANDARWRLNDALAACCRQDFTEAIKILTEMDRYLTEQKILNEWFEARLRLIAAHRLAGQDNRVAALARQLDARAQKARDWLTLRRLERLLDVSEPATPLALLAPLATGPFAGGKRTALPVRPPAPTAPAESPAAAPTPAAFVPTPLDEGIRQLYARQQQIRDPKEEEAVRAELLSLPVDHVTHPLDATRLLALSRFLVGDDVQGRPVWDWAEAIARPFAQTAKAQNLLATLGHVLLVRCPRVEEFLTPARVEQLFRQSLDLDPTDPGNFGRAGSFYLFAENLGEAERCLARGFRLLRNNSALAVRLADVYKRTERPRDALAVLDISLREGCEDPNAAWEAGLCAFQIGQFDALLTYFDKFEAMLPGRDWIQYYRALALLEQGKSTEALAAIDEEARRSPEKEFLVTVVRACVLQALGQVDAFRESFHKALVVPLVKVDYLSPRGVENLFSRLWKASLTIPEDDQLRRDLVDRMLAAGVAPDAMFDALRQHGEKSEGVHFYRLLVRQLLDAQWATSPGCLSGQDNWLEYVIQWGVLAQDEDEAARLVLDWQKRCYPMPAEVVNTETDSRSYTDKAGVVWQGLRWGKEPEKEESKGAKAGQQES